MTEAAVWAALAEIPDPEIPVISLVDLGVVKGVSVEGERVRIEFTPTFMGCPALDAMRRQMEESVAELGGEAQVDVLLDDSWSTDRITPAGREKRREAGFAPPAPRSAPTTPRSNPSRPSRSTPAAHPKSSRQLASPGRLTGAVTMRKVRQRSLVRMKKRSPCCSTSYS